LNRQVPAVWRRLVRQISTLLAGYERDGAFSGSSAGRSMVRDLPTKRRESAAGKRR
jgi:hypothetical protein